VFYWQKRVPLDSSPKLKILVVVAAHKQRQSLASQLGVLYKEIIFLILISVWIGCWDGDGGHKGKLKTDGNRIVCSMQPRYGIRPKADAHGSD
jgi:hypothetical protein